MQHRLQDFPISQVTYFPLSVAQWLESTKTMVYQEDKVEDFMKADRSVTLGGLWWKLREVLWKYEEYCIAISKQVLL